MAFYVVILIIKLWIKLPVLSYTFVEPLVTAIDLLLPFVCVVHYLPWNNVYSFIYILWHLILSYWQINWKQLKTCIFSWRLTSCLGFFSWRLISCLLLLWELYACTEPMITHFWGKKWKTCTQYFFNILGESPVLSCIWK